jgi:hypothetical protein
MKGLSAQTFYILSALVPYDRYLIGILENQNGGGKEITGAWAGGRPAEARNIVEALFQLLSNSGLSKVRRRQMATEDTGMDSQWWLVHYTCYRAAGWQVLGTTRGYSKCNKRYYHNGQPKLVLVRPLVANAVSCLSASFLPPIGALAKEPMPMIDINRLPLQGQGGLMDLLQTVVDPRKPRGVRHPVTTVVAIAICAVLSGARSFTAISEWAQILDRQALRKLGAKRRSPPSEPTIRRVLQRLDAVSTPNSAAG